ncbi:Hypothetical predicted protein, partial [Paramuricea clavata]
GHVNIALSIDSFRFNINQQLQKQLQGDPLTRSSMHLVEDITSTLELIMLY